MINRITRGDCIEVMAAMPEASIDFILTDPPYLVNYRDRSGRRVRNDNNTSWLHPAFAQMHRVLKDNSFAVSFYSWSRIDLFMQAWAQAGFTVAGHIVFAKEYSSATRYLQYRHEQAYLLMKGRPLSPGFPIPDIIPWTDYTGNKLHPTQKPEAILKPLIHAFTGPGHTVLDPFCGSGSTLAAARSIGRNFVGIELDRRHFRTAATRLFTGKTPSPASR